MNRLWIRLLSWHVLDPDALEGHPRTICGRMPSVAAEISDVLPAGKSCESCARIVLRAEDVLALDPSNDEVVE